jgi:hypothetical protein
VRSEAVERETAGGAVEHEFHVHGLRGQFDQGPAVARGVNVGGVIVPRVGRRVGCGRCRAARRQERAGDEQMSRDGGRGGSGRTDAQWTLLVGANPVLKTIRSVRDRNGRGRQTVAPERRRALSASQKRPEPPRARNHIPLPGPLCVPV